MPPALQATGITKRFPGVLANDHVDFTLEKGEIHALLGENGAGKSTLMNILYGLYQPDEGQILVDGQPVQMVTPHDAIARGIGMVHQHFMLVPPLTVTENIMLGQESLVAATKVFGGLATLDRRTSAARIRELSQQYGLAVDPDAYVRDLTVGAQQRVEIIKALYRSADILILDEPTAVLTPQEADELFVIMRGMVAQGKSIVFITHKLREVFAVADQISVMRGGQMVGSVKPAEATRALLAEMMVGREVILQIEKSEAHPAAPVLSVEGLRVADDRHHVTVDGVSLEVRSGEILGIAGVQGNGQTELAEALTGSAQGDRRQGDPAGRRGDSGDAPPARQKGHGARARRSAQTWPGAVVPHPRQPGALHLLSPTFFQRHRAGLSRHRRRSRAVGAHVRRAHARHHDLRGRAVRRQSAESDHRARIVAHRTGDIGGATADSPLLVANQPTRGLDVGSIEFIHGRIVEARDNGAAVLLISAELDEIMSLSDRIAVMYKGHILETLDAKTATREQLGLLMAGVTKEADHA